MRFILLLILSFSAFVHASTGVLSGTVTDEETGEPLPGVNVILVNTPFGTSTDQDGFFEIKGLQPASYTIRLSYIGYRTIEKTVKVSEGETTSLSFSLEESFLKIDELVVTGTRTGTYMKNAPVSTYVLHANEIEEIGASDVSDAIEWIPGISTYQSQFGDDIEVQGLTGKHVIILVNGVKVVGRLNDRFDLSQLPVGDIEKIEVIKGGASSLYGSEAMGGVINIITKDYKNEYKLSFQSDAGSYGRLNNSIEGYVPISGWKLSTYLSNRKSDGFDLDESNSWEDGHEFDKYDASMNISGNISESLSLVLSGKYMKEKLSMVVSNTFRDITHNERFGTSALFTNVFDEQFTGKLNLDFSQYDHRLDSERITTGNVSEGQSTIDWYSRAEATGNMVLDQHTLLGGYGIEYNKIESDRIFGNMKENTLQYVFLQDQYKVTDLFTLVPGIRYNYHSEFGSHIAPKLSFMHSPMPTFRFRVNYGSGFRSPTFKEMFFDFHQTTINMKVLGNPDLKPETSHSLSVNAEYWFEDTWQLSANIYFNQINDMISYEFQRIEGGTSYYEAENFNRVKTWGFELDLKFILFDFIENKYNYTYLDSENDETGEELSFKSKHRMSLVTKFAILPNVDFQLRQQYYSEQFYYLEDVVSEGGKATLVGRYLLHANVNVSLPYHIKVFGGVKNITDQVDIQFGPLPGIEWFAGIRLDVGKYF